MGKMRSRRSQKLQSERPTVRKRSLGSGEEVVSSRDVTFVVFFAVGQRVSHSQFVQVALMHVLKLSYLHLSKK